MERWVPFPRLGGLLRASLRHFCDTGAPAAPPTANYSRLWIRVATIARWAGGLVTKIGAKIPDRMTAAGTALVQSAVEEAFAESSPRMRYLLAVLARGGIDGPGFMQTHPTHEDQYKAEA